MSEKITRNQVEEGIDEYLEKKEQKWEIKMIDGNMFFRDGKSEVYHIKSKAEYIDPFGNGFNEWLVGSGSVENPSKPFEEARVKDMDGYIDNGDEDGDNLVGSGGLYFHVNNWKQELKTRGFPSEVEAFIESSIHAAIMDFEKNSDLRKPRSSEVMEKMSKLIEEGENS